MAKGNKYYVVWVGLNSGIYTSWDDCKAQITGVANAKYKSFQTRNEAEDAYQKGYQATLSAAKSSTTKTSISKPNSSEVTVAVDASCLGNPGKMEYRGVWTEDGSVIFNVGPLEDGTNNIGELLALIHAMAWMKKNSLNFPIYSDSKIAMGWVKQKTCKTKLERTSRNAVIFNLVERGEAWLKSNTFRPEIRKWDTKSWGEIPADFGRK